MLEEKIEALTKEIVALRQAIEKGGTATATKAAEKAKPAAKGKSKPADDEDEDEDEDDEPKSKSKSSTAKGKTAAKGKSKKDEPEHDEDEVGAIFRKAAKKDKPACKKYLKKVDCEDLAELLTQPELFDAAYAFAEGVLEAEDEEDEDDDD